MCVNLKNLKEKDVYFVVDYRYNKKGDKLFAILTADLPDQYVFVISEEPHATIVSKSDVNRSFYVTAHVASFQSFSKSSNRVLMLK